MLDIEKSKKVVEQFINEFKKAYPSVAIGYIYDEDLGFFDIWHNNKTLQFENKKFLENIGILIKEILYTNGIFNISFNYDCTKDVNYIIKDTFNYAISSMTAKYSNSLKWYSFISEVNNFMSDINIATVAHSSTDILMNSKYNFIIEEDCNLCENKFFKLKNMDKSEERLAS